MGGGGGCAPVLLATFGCVWIYYPVTKLIKQSSCIKKAIFFRVVIGYLFIYLLLELFNRLVLFLGFYFFDSHVKGCLFAA